MSGLLLCGKKARRPLYIAHIEKNIYSIEELQYYLYNNIYLIGKDFFNDELTNFINDELEMGSLSQKLRNLMIKGGDFKDMVMVLLGTGSYYSMDELKGFEQTLKMLDSMSFSQRLKSKADGYFKSGRYTTAIKSYMEIITEAGRENESDEFIASIWNNMGSIYARLFLFREAYSCFKVASTLYPGQKIVDRLVVAAIMCEDEKIMDDLKQQFKISDDEIAEYDISLDYEKKHIRTTAEYGQWAEKLSYDNRKELSLYYEEVSDIIDKWKNEYRELVS